MKSAVLIVSAGLAGVPALAQTSMVVSPNFRTSVEGNESHTYPFSNPGVSRYQQIYDGASLNAVRNRRITHIAFRLDSSRTTDYPGGFVYTNLNIKLSISPRAVDGLSTTMQTNVGTGVQTVYNAPFTLPTLHAGPAPHAFDLVIPLQTPYLYTGGNLLLDVAGPIGPTTNPFPLDLESTQGDAVARCFAFQANPIAVDTKGLVTRFTSEAVTTCYANCDGSTNAPLLTVYDFLCFQWQFFAGTTYANCDNSTTPPVLNVNDFTCFQTRFAEGCP